MQVIVVVPSYLQGLNMWTHYSGLLLCCLFSAAQLQESLQVVNAFTSEDDNAPTPELARHHGYKCETHRVETEDGYILSLHRLPGSPSAPVDPSLPPVLLQHGLLDSSAAWLIAGPQRALGYLLADQGYDVWLGNARGNVYSKAHRTLSVDDPRFWNWTWHEMGKYDLPAVIDHILNVTGHRQIFYVGHSMGTTMFFVLCTTVPEYNAKIRYMVALAPVAFMAHTKSPIRILAPFANNLEKIADYFGKGQFLPRSSILDSIIKYTCEEFKFEREICENYLFLICGHDPEQFDQNLLPIILGHNPAGTSTKTLVHYAQEIKIDHFQQYDYGAEKNMILYNSSSPPQYNLSLVSVPLSLLYGDNDLLATPLDVRMLFSRLENHAMMSRVNLSSFNHLDFLWARDVKTLVYDKVEALFKRFRGSTCQNNCIEHNNKELGNTEQGMNTQTKPSEPNVIKTSTEKRKSFFKSLSHSGNLGSRFFYSQVELITDQLRLAGQLNEVCCSLIV